uniref:Uncharacterized protein n=1 Tax=Vespula pensylvanica TaxID=30213 RepID=A0A834U5B9_VESPE|nr:hypothetical protein H0235_011594 [Vespula pensylvanica]
MNDLMCSMVLWLQNIPLTPANCHSITDLLEYCSEISDVDGAAGRLHESCLSSKLIGFAPPAGFDPRTM